MLRCKVDGKWEDREISHVEQRGGELAGFLPVPVVLPWEVMERDISGTPHIFSVREPDENVHLKMRRLWEREKYEGDTSAVADLELLRPRHAYPHNSPTEHEDFMAPEPQPAGPNKAE